MTFPPQRFATQLLTGTPAGSAVAVAARLLAIQAQDPRGARLAIRARSSGLTAADVDRALTDRSLVVSWLNRGTLHLVRSEDYWWLHQLTAPTVVTANNRRLQQEGLTSEAADRGVAVIVDELSAHGPRVRGQLRESVARAGVRVAGQALVHLLLRASLDGLVVRGPMVGAEQAFVLVGDWLGPAPPLLDRDTALAELARRYLDGHGPAEPADLAKWSGLSLGEARRGFGALRAEPTQAGRHEDGGHVIPSPRLLGAFDPLLLGWASRAPVLGDHAPTLVTSNGVFRPFALVAGRAEATWRWVRGTVQLTPFAPLADEVAEALALDAQDVARFLNS